VLWTAAGVMESHLATAEADCNDADIVSVWQELWLDGGCGRHGVCVAEVCCVGVRLARDGEGKTGGASLLGGDGRDHDMHTCVGLSRTRHSVYRLRVSVYKRSS
jgi:hypothetical protein